MDNKENKHGIRIFMLTVCIAVIAFVGTAIAMMNNSENRGGGYFITPLR